MRRALTIFLLAVSAALAQNAPAKPDPGSVSGTVKDSASGKPIADASVSTFSSAKAYRDKTDSQGVYTLHDMPPGAYQIAVMVPGFAAATRTIHVNAGDKFTSIDFHLDGYGSVSGIVMDREYYLGTARYVYMGTGYTDDQGHYTIRNLAAGRAYLILARKQTRQLPARSDIPIDPKRRQATPAPTYYPKSPSIDGAIPLVVRSGEEREGVDIEMPREAAYCLEAVTTAAGAPASMEFQLAPTDPEEGSLNFGGYLGFGPDGISPPDGRIRVCDLHPGQYRLVTTAKPDESLAPPFFGITQITISDKDLRDFRADAQPAFSFPGEVKWAEVQPGQPEDLRATIGVMPLARPRYIGEGSDAHASVPGAFTLEKLLPDAYTLRTAISAPGVYVKDIIYGGSSILNMPLRPAAGGNSGVRIELANDGGGLAAKVNDSDGNPVPDINVYIMPTGATTEGALSAQFVAGNTDQTGLFRTVVPLAPGKYLVLATTTHVTMAAESVARLFRARLRGTEVDIAAGVMAQLSLVPVILE